MALFGKPSGWPVRPRMPTLSEAHAFFAKGKPAPSHEMHKILKIAQSAGSKIVRPKS